jgi:hypothetical protein
MPRGCLLGCLTWGLLWALLRPAPAEALDLLGWLRGDHRSYTAMYLGGAEPGMTASSNLSADPLRPVFGRASQYSPVVPTYNWGYFGAPYRPANFCHTDYYGDVSCWCYRRR